MIHSAKVVLITSFLVKILCLIVIFFHDVHGSIYEEDITSVLPESDLENQTKSFDESYHSKDDETEISDADYPYEKILELVKETKKLLSSSNDTEKKEKLNFDPEDYEAYLAGDLRDSASYEVDRGLCRSRYQERRPKKFTGQDGKLYYILNVGKDFSQRISSTLCVRPGAQCGDPQYWPEGYVFTCEQTFRTSRQLFTVPADNIDISAQKLRYVTVPNACECNRKSLYDDY